MYFLQPERFTFLKSALCSKILYTVVLLGFPSCQPMEFNISPFVLGVECVCGGGKDEFWAKRLGFHSLLNLIRFECIFRRCKFHGLGKLFM